MSPGMRVLLASTYELGHQPLHLASPAAALRAAGHEVRVADLAIEPLEDELLTWAEAVALSVPMHTATRLAVDAAQRIAAIQPGLPICLYGLYAGVGSAQAGSLVDRAIAGEYETALVDWADGVGGGVAVELGRTPFRVPDREGLPSLDRYAHLAVGGEHRLVGYTEASHGCRHRCRHCPIPTVYQGRIRIVEREVVLGDVAQLVDMGANHVTFGDPDFLNAPQHSVQLVRELHRRFPGLTFDVTTKVELILRHEELWEELAEAGLLFVVSAFETTNDTILSYLDKGHTAADEAAAVATLRRHDVEIRPTWLPFTPWSTLDDLRDTVRFLLEHDLTGNVDPVQLTIRLLIPDGSLLLEVPEVVPYLDGYDPVLASWRWHAADPRVDELQVRLSGLLEAGIRRGDDDQQLLSTLVQAIMPDGDAAAQIPAGAVTGRPRLTEPWFC